MIHILVADDEKRIRDVIREYAELEGYIVSEASDGMEAIRLCQEENVHVIIMDAMMPRLDGFSACKEIRKSKRIPIIMLSARGEEYDKLFGFEMGADDYVVKPFSPKELMARVKVVTARNSVKSGMETGETMSFSLGGLIIKPQGRTVLVDGVRVGLTRKEYELLFFLATHKNTVFSRKELLSAVWLYEFFDDDRTVDAHIKMLRNSLGVYRSLIVTVRGVGYKFEA